MKEKFLVKVNSRSSLPVEGARLFNLNSAMSFLLIWLLGLGLYSGWAMTFSMGITTAPVLQLVSPPGLSIQSFSVILLDTSYSPRRTFRLENSLLNFSIFLIASCLVGIFINNFKNDTEDNRYQQICWCRIHFYFTKTDQLRCRDCGEMKYFIQCLSSIFMKI